MEKHFAEERGKVSSHGEGDDVLLHVSGEPVQN